MLLGDTGRAQTSTGRFRTAVEPFKVVPRDLSSGVVSPVVVGSAFSSIGLPELGRAASAPSIETRKKSSKERLAFDQMLSTDFRKKLQQDLTSRERRLGKLTDQGISDAARFQNFKKEQYSRQFDLVQESTSSPCDLSPADERATSEAEVQRYRDNFVQGVNSLNHQIEELSKSLRLEHLEKRGHDKRDAAREEAKRQKEAELRRLRKKEQMARDPKRKVVLKIESQRHCRDDDDKEKQHPIPMHIYEVYSLSGSSKVDIVDVLAIKNKCEALNQSATVKSMLEVREREERLQRVVAYGAQPLTPQCDKNLNVKVRKFTDSISTASLLSYEERCERAAQVRREHEVESAVLKMSNFRSNWKYPMPFALDSTSKPVKELEMMAQDPKFAQDVAKELSHKLEAQKARSRRVCVIKAVSMLNAIGVHSEDLPTPRTLLAMNADEGRKSRLVQEVLVKQTQESSARARRRWALVRACSKWLLLLFTARKRAGASIIVKAVCNQLGEWARIKRIMGRARASVQALQKRARLYFEQKKQRCMELSKEWDRTEEVYLSGYFQKYAAQLVSERQEQAEAEAKAGRLVRDAKQHTIVFKMIEAGVHDGNIAIDWRKYKIPSREKHAILRLRYTRQLKKHIRDREGVVNVVQTVVSNEREIIHFLKSFGAVSLVSDISEYSRAAYPEVKAESACFWQMSEDVLIRIIAVCVQSMGNIEPFQDHPANRDVPGHFPRLATYRPDCDAIEFANSILKQAERPGSNGHFGLKTLLRSSQATGHFPHSASKGHILRPLDHSKSCHLVWDGERQPQDVEEVFRSFTPRLKSMCEDVHEER